MSKVPALQAVGKAWEGRRTDGKGVEDVEIMDPLIVNM